MYKCDTNFTWNGSDCISDTRTAICANIPANAHGTGDNSEGTFIQIWDGDSWEPETYVCEWDCDENYEKNGEICTYVVGDETCIKYGDFAITSEVHEDSSDWESIVTAVCGDNYRVLDWNDLESFYADGGDLVDLYDGLGQTEYGNSAYVTVDGDHNYSTTRYYYASRHEHNKPGNFMAHDNIDNYLISLGSWYGSNEIFAIKENLFEEDYESYSVDTLPADYIIVYNGAGTSSQKVVEEDGNKFLQTKGQTSWSLAMRKDFDTDFPDILTVEWKMQTRTVANSTNYNSDGFAGVGGFSIKNETEITALVSMGNRSDGNMYVYVGSYSKKVDRNAWISCKMVIDFANEKYDIYVDGELLVEDYATIVADLNAAWNSYGEDACFRFSSGNHSSTTTLFDDIVIH